ncbi:MAG TPA: hypothetical protein VJM53_05815 [Burkholderiales bacterium]|nr:hypothetical protein [Burkholderiales bacterium]
MSLFDRDKKGVRPKMYRRVGTPMAICSAMNGADPTTPEELERILRTAPSASGLDVEDELYDDFEALCRMLATERSNDALITYPLRRAA